MRSDRLLPRLDSPLEVAIVAIGLLAGTALLYAVDVFHPSGGIVWVPFHAALVGLASAAVVGYRDRGIVAGFAVAYAPFLGFRLDWGLLEISSRPLTDRLAYVLRLDGLAALAVEAAVVGVIGFGVGRILSRVTGDYSRSASVE